MLDSYSEITESYCFLFCRYGLDKKNCFKQNHEMIWDIRLKHPCIYIMIIGDHVVNAWLAKSGYFCRMSNHLLEIKR